MNLDHLSTLVDHTDVLACPWLADALDALCDVDAGHEDLEPEPDEDDGYPVRFVPRADLLSGPYRYEREQDDWESVVGGELDDWGHRTGGHVLEPAIDPGWGPFYQGSGGMFSGDQRLWDEDLPRWQRDAVAYEGLEGTLFWPIEALDP